MIAKKNPEKNPYKLSNKLLAVIFLLWEISYGLVMVLGTILCSCFNTKGVEFTCMATWLPYKSMFVHNRCS